MSDNLENTVEYNPENSGQSENGNGNSNGHKKPELKTSFDHAYNQMQQPSSVRPLIESGDDPHDLLMRTIIPGKKDDSYRSAVAIAIYLRKCREAGDTAGEEEMRDIMALLPSMNGQSRNQLVTALVGAFTDIKNPVGGFMEKVKGELSKGFRGGQV